MQKKEWIANLKAGDKVIVSGRYGGKTIETIDRVTPTGFVKIRHSTYGQDGFLRTSDKWAVSSLEEATPEKIEAIHKNRIIKAAIYKLRNINSLAYEQAIEILKILDTEETK